MLGLYTRLRDSAFKRSINELPVGSEVEVEEPKGSFLLPEETDERFVFIAGGIGITQSSAACSATSPRNSSSIGSRSSTRIVTASLRPWLTELLALEQGNPNLQLVLTMTDDPAWEGESRGIDAELLHDHLGDELQSSTYLIAGPPAMVDGVGTLQAAGVPEEHVRPDRFSGY